MTKKMVVRKINRAYFTKNAVEPLFLYKDKSAAMKACRELLKKNSGEKGDSIYIHDLYYMHPLDGEEEGELRWRE